MITKTFAQIFSPELAKDAIINDEFPGFREDYLILHCLLRIFKPNSVFEIGTNMGKGTSIICNAVPEAKVYTLDLPTELANISLQHPISEGKGDKVGSLCTFPFTQLRGDSLTFKYKDYPSEAYYIDGEHTYINALEETKAAVACKPKLIVWHDTDMPCVLDGLTEALKGKTYDLYRVIDTRISYAVRKEGRK